MTIIPLTPKFVLTVLVEFPEISNTIDKIQDELKLSAFLYCFLNDISTPINRIKNNKSYIAKDLKNELLNHLTNGFTNN